MHRVSFYGLVFGKLRLAALILVPFWAVLPETARADHDDLKAPGAIADALSITLLTEEYPPFNYTENGQILGAGGEVVRAMAAHLGYHKPIQSLPWKRVILRLEADPDVAAFSMTRTSQREDLYQWVGPIVEIEAGIYEFADHPDPVRSLDDIRNVPAIGVQAGGADEIALRQYGMVNLEPLHNPEVGLQMLAAGRIDLLVSSDIELHRQLADTGIASSLIRRVYSFGSSGLYLAFSRDTDQRVVTIWQSALDAVVANGQFARIMAQYGAVSDQTTPFSGSLAPGQ